MALPEDPYDQSRRPRGEAIIAAQPEEYEEPVVTDDVDEIERKRQAALSLNIPDPKATAAILDKTIPAEQRLGTYIADEDRVKKSAAKINETYDARANQAKESQARRDHNAAARATSKQTGQQFLADASGYLQPVVDPLTQKPTFTPETSPVRYEPKTGKPFVTKRDDTGTMTIENPDKDAKVGANPDDPTDTNLYRQNKAQPWATVDPEVAAHSKDPHLAAEAGKFLHSRAIKDVSAKLADIDIALSDPVKKSARLTDKKRAEAEQTVAALSTETDPESQKVLAEAKAQIAADDERRGLEKQAYELKLQKRDIEKLGPAAYLQKIREDEKSRLASLPDDEFESEAQARKVEVEAQTAQIGLSREQIRARVDEITNSLQTGVDGATSVKLLAERQALIDEDSGYIDQHNAAIAKINDVAGASTIREEKRTAKIKSERDRMRTTPEMAPIADKLDALDADFQARRVAVDAETDPERKKIAQDTLKAERDEKTAIIAKEIEGVETSRVRTELENLQTAIGDVANPVAILNKIDRGELEGKASSETIAIFRKAIEENSIDDLQKALGIADREEARKQLKTNAGIVALAKEGARSLVPQTQTALLSTASGYMRGASINNRDAANQWVEKNLGLTGEEATAKTRQLADIVAGDKKYTEAVAARQLGIGDKKFPSPLPGLTDAQTHKFIREGYNFSEFGKELAKSADQANALAERIRKENPDDPRLVGTKSHAFVEGAAQMPANLAIAMIPGLNVISNFSQLYDEAFKGAKSYTAPDGKPISDDVAHRAAMISASVNAPIETVADYILLGKAMPKAWTSKLAALGAKMPTRTFIAKAVGKALTEGVTELVQGRITDVVGKYSYAPDAVVGAQDEQNFFGGLGGGVAAEVGTTLAELPSVRATSALRKAYQPREGVNLEDVALADQEIKAASTLPEADEIKSQRDVLLQELQANPERKGELAPQILAMDDRLRSEPAKLPRENRTDLARALVKIAQGVPIDNLSDAERTVVAGAKTAAGINFIEDESGTTIITDTAREWLRGISPKADSLIGMDASQAREFARSKNEKDVSTKPGPVSESQPDVQLDQSRKGGESSDTAGETQKEQGQRQEVSGIWSAVGSNGTKVTVSAKDRSDAEAKLATQLPAGEMLDLDSIDEDSKTSQQQGTSPNKARKDQKGRGQDSSTTENSAGKNVTFKRTSTNVPRGTKSRDSSAVEHRAHNSEAVGSSPTPATNRSRWQGTPLAKPSRMVQAILTNKGVKPNVAEAFARQWQEKNPDKSPAQNQEAILTEFRAAGGKLKGESTAANYNTDEEYWKAQGQNPMEAAESAKNARDNRSADDAVVDAANESLASRILDGEAPSIKSELPKKVAQAVAVVGNTDRPRAAKLVQKFSKALNRYGNAFDTIEIVPESLGSAGAQFDPSARKLRLSLADIETWNEADMEAGMQAVMAEEAIHRITTDMEKDGEFNPVEFWKTLPGPIRELVDATVSRNSGVQQSGDWARGHEAVRLLLQADAEEFGRAVTEAQGIDPTWSAKWREFLDNLVDRLQKALGELRAGDSAQRQAIESTLALATRRADELGILEKSVSATEATPYQSENGPVGPSEQEIRDGDVPSRPGSVVESGDPGSGGVEAPVLPEPASGETPTVPLGDAGEATSKKLPPARFADLGEQGIAYTDNNDAVEYRWAAAELDDLIISNDDTGRINALYPQELQPRDRSTAGSQAQVDDIAKNANFDRLSVSESVGNGAPIVGPEDAVAESGNGRLMGLRRAYDRGLPSVKAYREKMEANAGKFGLDAETVAKMKQPVLVRVRQTLLDRRKFAELANVSNVSPMREVEIAKKDAGNFSPALLALFNPTEEGDIFAAQNQSFLREFVNALVPKSERPAIIDSRSNLSQTGMRRIRNAVFAYAYGTSPEAMNALGRMTESVDADGRNLTNALLAAAPKFADQAALIKKGALFDLPITSDLLTAVQELIEIRNRGDKVEDAFSQAGLFGESITPFQKEIVRFLDKNARSGKRIAETLRRYAAALDSFGNPQQAGLFETEAPTREGLWNLAQHPSAQTILSSGDRKQSPQAWQKAYNKLFALQRSGTRLTPGQQLTLNRAERELGQSLMFADAEEGVAEQFAQTEEQTTLFSTQRTYELLDKLPAVGPIFKRRGIPPGDSVSGGQEGSAETLPRRVFAAARRGTGQDRQATDGVVPSREIRRRSEIAGLLSAASPDLVVPQAILKAIPLATNRTTEHEVRRSRRVAIKITKPDSFGVIPLWENGRMSLVDSLPSEYVRRIALFADTFGTELAIEGLTVTDGLDGDEVSIVTSQEWQRPADPSNASPDYDAISEYMRALGFQASNQGGNQWVRPGDGVYVADARRDNFILTSRGVQAIDLPVTQLDKGELASLTGNLYSTGRQGFLFDLLSPEQREGKQALLESLYDTGPAPVVAEPTPPVERKVEPKVTSSPKETKGIVDFGEKIEGARKDLWQNYSQAIIADLPEDAREITLTKHFPEPDYGKLLETGHSPHRVAMLKAIRDLIPKKPQTSWKLARWAQVARALHKTLSEVVSTDSTISDERLDELTAKTTAIHSRIKLYESIGFPGYLKAKEWDIKQSRGFSTFAGENISPGTLITYATNKDRMEWRMFSKKPDAGEAFVDVAEQIREKIDADAAKPAQEKKVEFGVYHDRRSGDYFLGKKGLLSVIRLKTGFDSVKAARDYLKDNYDELAAKWEDIKRPIDLRKPNNLPRVGPAHRDEDVTPELFAEAFGFRGVQFGNYVEGDRRQADLNEAFDALMDMADALGIPPRALSLDGSLGLAFGARGHGSARAHYESGKVVINITKTSGPGTLAHEWFHGFDNYFARVEKTGATSPVALREFASESRGEPMNVRTEVWNAFKGIQRAINSGGFSKRSDELDAAKSKPYYSTPREKAARAFESYVTDRLKLSGIENDYLANIANEGQVAYPSKEELDGGIRSAYDNLFNVLDTKPTERGVALYSSSRGDQSTLDLGTYRNPGELDFSDKEKNAGQLVKENLGLATTIAGDYSNITGVERDDVIQEARKALVKAARAFDSNRGVKFSTYAGRAMRNELNELYGRQSRISQNEVNSLDEPTFDDSEETQKDRVVDQSDRGPRRIEREETSALLDAAIAELPPQPQKIVQMSREGLSGEEIGTRLGISRQRVNTVLSNAQVIIRQKLARKGVRGQEEGVLYSTPRNELEDLLQELRKDMPSLAEVESLRQRANAEPDGGRTIGKPEKAKYSNDTETRRATDVIQELRDERMQRQTEDEWIKEARAMLSRDPDGVKKTLLRKALDPAKNGTFTAVEVKAAQILVPELMRRAFKEKSLALRKEAFALAWAYDAGGSEQARAFAARRDPFKSPAERHTEFLTKMISTPTAAQRKVINAAPDAKEKQARLEKAQNERLAKIEKALADMGVTLEDIFSGEAYVRLKGAAMVENAMSSYDARKRKALRLIQDQFPDTEIARVTGLSVPEIQALETDFMARLSARLDELGDDALDVSKFDIEALFSSARPDVGVKLTAAERARRKEAILKAMGFGRSEQRNKKELIKRRKPKRQYPVESYAGPSPSDDPVEAERLTQMGLEWDENRKQWNKNPQSARPGEVPAEKMRQERIRFDIDQPWEYVHFDPANRDQVMRAARLIQASDANVFDMFYEYWINSILSGPQTHAVNIMGNGGMAAWEYLMQRPMEAAINLVAKDKNSASFGELSHVYRGLMPGIMNGYRAGLRAFQAEQDFFESDKLNAQIEFSSFDKGGDIRSTIPGAIGRAIRIPARALMFMDSFFKYATGQMEVGAQAYRMGVAQGLEGKALEDFIRGQVNLPGSVAWQRAVAKAQELTFQSEIPEKLQQLSRFRSGSNATTIGGKLLALFLGMTFPFIKTPYNIFRIGLRKSPLGAINVGAHIAQGLYSMKKGRPFVEGYDKGAMVRDMSEQLLAWGAATLLLGAIEGDADDDDKWLLITGGRPFGVDKQGERDLLNRTTGGTYQVRIGGRNGFYFNYGRLEPFATVLGTTADMIRIGKSGDHADWIFKMMAGLVAQAQDKTFLQGIGTIVDTIDALKSQNVDKLGAQYARQYLGALVPNIIRQPIRNWDEAIRDSKYAGLAYMLTAAPSEAEQRSNLYGQPMTKQGSSLGRLFFAEGMTPTPVLERGDQFLMNYNRVADKPYTPERTTSYSLKNALGEKVKMTPEQIADFDRRSGMLFAQKLKGWLTPAVIANPKEDHAKRFQNDLEEARREIKALMVGKK